MLVDKTVPVADIENVIKKASGKMLESLQLFDVYEGKQIPEGKKERCIQCYIQKRRQKFDR